MSKKPSALKRLEAHNSSPAGTGHRERSHDSRHSSHSRETRDRESRDRGECESRRSSNRPDEEGRPRSSGRDNRDEEAPGWAKQLLKSNKDTDRRLRALEAEVKGTGKRVSRKRERSPAPEFKYKRNRTQYEFNQKVLDTIKTALEVSDEDERSEALNEGKNLICERNKHIKLAEKFGWETVECYVDEPLASDSDDEKRIRRAVKEGKAMREEKRKSLKLTKASSTTSSRPFSTDTSRPGQKNRIVLKRSNGLAKDVNCFRCGRAGHLARFCKNNIGNLTQPKP